MKARWAVTCATLLLAGGAVKAAPAGAAKGSASKTVFADGQHHDSDVDEDDAAAAEQATTPPDTLASRPHVTGPKRVDLGHQAEIEVPAGMVLFEQAAAQDLMKQNGNDPAHTVAIVVPNEPQPGWWVAIDANDIGYVDDDDAGELEADALLAGYRRGVAAQNTNNATHGIPELTVDDWSEPPGYDKASHQLHWGIAAHTRDDKVISYTTRVLGRNGVLSLDIIVSADQIATAKAAAGPVASAVHFKAGARYEDHASGDKSAGIGLRGLVLAGVGGAVVKKTGIVIAIFKKGFIFVIAAIAAVFLFGIRKRHRIASGFGGPSDDGAA